MKPLYDPHQSYGSEDDTDTREFADLNPIAKGLLISAGAGVAISLFIFLVIYLILEGIL